MRLICAALLLAGCSGSNDPPPPGGDPAPGDATIGGDSAPVNCFPGGANFNLSPAAVTGGPAAAGGVSCDLDNLLDQNLGFVGLGLTTMFDGTPVDLAGQQVTSCVVADMGARCTLSANVGVGYIMQTATDACGDPGGNQCAVMGACGALPGANLLLFVADDMSDVRYVSSVGNCGPGEWSGNLHPLTAFSDTNDLTSVRYLIACRPFGSCGPGDANIEVKSYHMIYRQ